MIMLPSFADRRAAYRYALQIEGVTYRMRFWWSERAKAWYFDLASSDGTPIRTGVRLTANWPATMRRTHALLPSGIIYLSDVSGQGTEATHQAELGDARHTAGRLRLVYLSREELGDPPSGSSRVVSVEVI